MVVVGPGAIGGLLAARLRMSGLGVALLDRDPVRAKRLTEEGLGLSGPDYPEPCTVRLHVTTETAGLGEPELVLLCVKARDTRAAAARLGAFPEATIGVLQNGLGRAEELAGIVGNRDRVVGIVTTEGATRGPEGVRHCGRGPTRVAPLTAAGQARAERTVQLLKAAGFDATRVEDLAGLIWEKLVVNAAINALTGLLDCENGALLRAEAAAALGDGAAEEVAATAQLLGVAGDWSAERARERWREVAVNTSANISSTLQDLRKNRKTEVFAINGAVAEAARRAGSSAPINEMLARLIEAREQLLGPAHQGES